MKDIIFMILLGFSPRSIILIQMDSLTYEWGYDNDPYWVCRVISSPDLSGKIVLAQFKERLEAGKSSAAMTLKR